MREQLRPYRCKPVEKRFHMAHGTNVIRKEIARLLSQLYGNVDEIVDVQPALFPLQSSQMGGGNGDRPRDVGLAAPLRFPKLPEDAAVHAQNDCTTLANASMRPADIANAATENRRTSQARPIAVLGDGRFRFGITS